MHLERSIEIAAPPTRVWSVLTDIERWPEWTASIEAVERIDRGRFGRESAARITQPKLQPALWQVTSFEDGKGFVWESHQPGQHSVANHQLETLESGGTRVTLAVDLSGVFITLLTPFIRGTVRKYLNWEAEGLKAHVEGGQR